MIISPGGGDVLPRSRYVRSVITMQVVVLLEMVDLVSRARTQEEGSTTTRQHSRGN